MINFFNHPSISFCIVFTMLFRCSIIVIYYFYSPKKTSTSNLHAPTREKSFSEWSKGQNIRLSVEWNQIKSSYRNPPSITCVYVPPLWQIPSSSLFPHAYSFHVWLFLRVIASQWVGKWMILGFGFLLCFRESIRNKARRLMLKL